MFALFGDRIRIDDRLAIAAGGMAFFIYFIGCAELETIWGTSLPGEVGRDLTGILEATRDGDLAGLLIGGVDPYDLPDPALMIEAMKASKFVVSLEILPTAATEWADVVLPVAPVVEKTGTFISWEGRRRPFDMTLHATGALPDSRVLHQLADELDIDLGLVSAERAIAEIDRLGGTTLRPSSGLGQVPVPPPLPPAGRALLASWHQLIDEGTLLEGEGYLKGTARPAVARLSAATAQEIGAAQGEIVTVSTAAGSVSLPLEVTAMPDRVVWIPMNAPNSKLRRDLHATVGQVVGIAAGGSN
ncbi:molybdopterin dinucleotide binding domain-containing protein, partial [Cumulibacter manganitolerans]|uniref:molybdopterin dinucleotide binding domain-containing protein n=1 Tax=Cumulibacter manganitolerans TaxID=1884992 RepID=UPI001295AD6C